MRFGMAIEEWMETFREKIDAALKPLDDLTTLPLIASGEVEWP